LKDLYRSHFGIYYGISIAFAIHSVDRSLDPRYGFGASPPSAHPTVVRLYKVELKVS
jgi:hypothetical protein